MKRLAIFYHARIEGGGIRPDYGRMMLQAQMDTFAGSGLYHATNEMFIGLNGTGTDTVREYSPPGCKIIEHGANAESLLPTYLFAEEWLKSHPDWYVCFWHTKGITHPEDPLNIVWRRCCEKHVIENWPTCVSNLDSGFDSAGAHWLTAKEFGPQVIPAQGFWGGAFYWATAKFLLSLPKLPASHPQCREDWFIPERWIGTGPEPRVRDHAHHWPGLDACARSLS